MKGVVGLLDLLEVNGPNNLDGNTRVIAARHTTADLVL